MSAYDDNPYSMHFAQFAGKLEQHLRKNGISCSDADKIIEESSALYFDKIQSSSNKLFRLVKKWDPADIFIESAHKAIEHHIPEAKNTFGSQREIARILG